MVLAKEQTYIDQWHRTESPEIDPQKYNQLTFDKGAKTIKWSKENSAETSGHRRAKKMKLDTDLTLFTKIN